MAIGRTPDMLAVEMAEQARVNLKRYISHKCTRGANTLVVYLLDPEIEQRLANRRPLSAAERRWLLEAVRAEAGRLPPTAQNPCLLTTIDIRHRARREIEASFLHLAVLSYQELSPDMNIQPIARISLDGEPESGPLDLVDEAISELRYEDAEQQLRQSAGIEPLTVVTPRIPELCHLWNEAGRVEHLVSTLAIWLEVPVGPAESSEIRALIDHPEPEGFGAGSPPAILCECGGCARSISPLSKTSCARKVVASRWESPVRSRVTDRRTPSRWTTLKSRRGRSRAGSWALPHGKRQGHPARLGAS
jgi:hypothetical protein